MTRSDLAIHSSGTGAVEPDPDASYLAVGIVRPRTKLASPFVAKRSSQRRRA